MPSLAAPAVTVLVPVYNALPHLRHCLDSLAAQTLESLQVVCVDDGSTDGSSALLAEYAARDPRFKVLTKENTGYGDSLNQALDRARGTYVGIVESDDFVEPTMFEELLALARSTGADVVRSNYREHVAGATSGEDVLKQNVHAGLPLGVPLAPREHHLVLKGNPAIWTGLYRRAFLDEEGIRFLPTPGASFQDSSFGLKTRMAARTLALTDRAYYHYRVDNPESSSHAEGKVYCVCDEYDEVWRFLRERPALGEEFAREIPPLEFASYRWNTWRLARGVRDRFYDRFEADFAALERKGLVEPDLFDPEDQADIRQFLDGPDGPTELFERLWGRRHVRTTLMVRVVGRLRTEEDAAFARGELTRILAEAPTDAETVVDDAGRDDVLPALRELVAPRVEALFLSELCAPGTSDVHMADLRGKRIRLAEIHVPERAPETEAPRDVALVRAARKVAGSGVYQGLQSLAWHAGHRD